MTIVQVCNLALARLGASRINTLTENTVEAQQCALFYPISRDTILSDFDWGFARKRKFLALKEVDYTDWEYAYELPTDFLTIREIISPNIPTGSYYDHDLERLAFSDSPRYEIASNEEGTRSILLTNIEEVEIKYTARVTDTNAYPSQLITALGWLLSSELAMPLRGKPELQTQYYATYLSIVSAAKTTNANQDNNKKVDSNNYLRVRK